GQPVVPAHEGVAQRDAVGIGGHLVAEVRRAAAVHVGLDVGAELVAALGGVVGGEPEPRERGVHVGVGIGVGLGAVGGHRDRAGHVEYAPGRTFRDRAV